MTSTQFLRLLAFSISRYKFFCGLSPNWQQNGNTQTSQCSTPSRNTPYKSSCVAPTRPGRRSPLRRVLLGAWCWYTLASWTANYLGLFPYPKPGVGKLTLESFWKQAHESLGIRLCKTQEFVLLGSTFIPMSVSSNPQQAAGATHGSPLETIEKDSSMGVCILFEVGVSGGGSCQEKCGQTESALLERAKWGIYRLLSHDRRVRRAGMGVLRGRRLLRLQSLWGQYSWSPPCIRAVH